MENKKARTRYKINEIIAKRWSPRSFDATKEVSKEDLLSICEAARWAPSSVNEQPWNYIIWDKFKDKENYNKAFSCLNEWNQKWAKNAPVLIGVFAYNLFSQNNNNNRWALYDTGAATMSMLLQATELGLVSHQMGGYDANKLLQEFEITDDYTSISVIALGYQAEADILEEPFRERESAERIRKDLRENFYFSTWKNPVE
jgi:nitroreductase